MKIDSSRAKHLREIFLGSTSESGIPIGIIGVGMIFPLVAWIVEFVAKDFEISIYGLVQMHSQNPILIFVDLIPIILGFGGYYLEQFFKISEQYYQEQLKQRDTIIYRNAKIAKQIGEGDFNIDVNQIDDKDILGKSLIRMRDNLLETARKEADQNWIAAGKDKISDILRMYNDIDKLSYETLVALIDYIKVIQGAFYVYDEEENVIINKATYAYNRRKYLNQRFAIGEGLIGQAAFEMATIYLKEIPADYVTITSGLLKDKKPNTILIVPLITDEKLQGIVEFASLDTDISPLKIRFVEELSDIIARTLFNLKVNARTEKLLRDAQKMTEELRENEEELRQNAEEMRATHEELERTNAKLEQQIQAVENSQKKIHSLLENASEVISIYDENLRLTYISPSVVNIYGFTPEEMMEGKDLDRLTAKGNTDLKEMFQALLRDPETPQRIQYTFMRKDGRKIHVETVGRNLLHDPAIQGIIFNSQDITERKRAEKEERMKSKMQALSENSPDMIMRLNLVGQFFYANPIVKIFTGVDNKTIVGKTLDQVDFNDQIKEFFTKVLLDVSKTNQKQSYETVFPTTFGDRIQQVNAIPEFNDEKELETVLIVAHDITEQKQIENEIKEKNKNITESINYAERIQKALLPDTRLVQEYLPKSFIFYKPRDVVSGDFPWFYVKGDIFYIAAVDCTGHGVPGALLSFVGYFLLNQTVDHDDDLNAGQLLQIFHKGVQKALKQDMEGAYARDGMDIAFCKIDLKKQKLQYAGAHRPLYLLRNRNLDEFKGDRKAIGGIPLGKKPDEGFTNHEIDIRQGDKIFFFSDGLPDQVGGPDNQKYSSKRIREAILKYPDYSMIQYHNYFNKDFQHWKGDNRQIDDVLLIGIEF
ncbi:MAG TPA: PAS domain S-box protein [Salinivirgaceae bacterium]|nr:PAS domain S-box protein [Salinivirgaceae bacterium]